MTVLTEGGRDYLNDLMYGRVETPINTIAVGTGDAPESEEDEELDDEIYRATAEDAIVEFDKVEATVSSTYATISIRGGLEVPAKTEITEVGILADDQLVYRDVRNPVRVNSGVELTLRLRLDIEEV